MVIVCRYVDDTYGVHVQLSWHRGITKCKAHIYFTEEICQRSLEKIKHESLQTNANTSRGKTQT